MKPANLRLIECIVNIAVTAFVCVGMVILNDILLESKEYAHLASIPVYVLAGLAFLAGCHMFLVEMRDSLSNDIERLKKKLDVHQRKIDKGHVDYDTRS